MDTHKKSKIINESSLFLKINTSYLEFLNWNIEILIKTFFEHLKILRETQKRNRYL